MSDPGGGRAGTLINAAVFVLHATLSLLQEDEGVREQQHEGSDEERWLVINRVWRGLLHGKRTKEEATNLGVSAPEGPRLLRLGNFAAGPPRPRSITALPPEPWPVSLSTLYLIS